MAKERKPDAKMDTKKMMKVYQKLATPGAPHKRLAKLEGSWTTQTRAWMEPGSAPDGEHGQLRTEDAAQRLLPAAGVPRRHDGPAVHRDQPDRIRQPHQEVRFDLGRFDELGHLCLRGGGRRQPQDDHAGVPLRRPGERSIRLAQHNPFRERQ